jgi:hypothetical protein
MTPRAARKRARDEDDPPTHPRCIRPPFRPDYGRQSHQGACWPRCQSCDRKHPGACTAFCRKCTEIGHSWRHCRLFVPSREWQRRKRALNTRIENLNITVPVVNPEPVMTPASLNSAIRAQLKAALDELWRQVGPSVQARLTMQNVNITTNILPSEGAAPIPRDTSLLKRVKPNPTIHQTTNRRPKYTKSSFGHSEARRPGFAPPVFGQPASVQAGFSGPTLSQKKPASYPSWLNPNGLSFSTASRPRSFASSMPEQNTRKKGVRTKF